MPVDMHMYNSGSKKSQVNTESGMLIHLHSNGDMCIIAYETGLNIVVRNTCLLIDGPWRDTLLYLVNLYEVCILLVLTWIPL